MGKATLACHLCFFYWKLEQQQRRALHRENERFCVQKISLIEMKLDFFILSPCFILAVMFCLQSLQDATMQGSNFPTYIHINICKMQAWDCGTKKVFIPLLFEINQFGPLIPCDSECVPCCIRWKGQAKSNLQQSVLEICKMARFSVNERTIDNAIQLASKAPICMSVKGVIVKVARGSCLSAKTYDNKTQLNQTEKKKRKFGSLQLYSFNYSLNDAI